jgi:hypothetical protein
VEPRDRLLPGVGHDLLLRLRAGRPDGPQLLQHARQSEARGGVERNVDVTREGDYELLAGAATYTVARYEVGQEPEGKEETLTVWIPSSDAAEKAVKAGSLKGTVTDRLSTDVTLTDSTQNLAKWLQTNAGKAMLTSDDKAVYRRLK